MDKMTNSMELVRSFGSVNWRTVKDQCELSYIYNDKYLVSHYRSGNSNFDSHLQVFDAETGTPLKQQTEIDAEKFFSIGNDLLVADKSNLYISDVNELSSQMTVNFDSRINSIAVCQKRRIISVGLEGGVIKIYSLGLSQIQEFAIDYEIKELYFLCNSIDSTTQLAVSASLDKTHRVVLIDIENGDVKELKGPRSEVSSILSDDQFLYASSGKKIFRWSRSGGRATTLYTAKGDCSLLNINDNNISFHNGTNALSCIQSDNGHMVWNYEKTAWSQVFSNQNKIVLKLGYDLLLIDAKTGELLNKSKCYDAIGNIALTTGGNKATISPFLGNTLCHWPLESNTIDDNFNPCYSIEHFQTLEDGSWATLQNGRLFLWCMDSNEPNLLITPERASPKTFYIDEAEKNIWIGDERIDCYCLLSGELLYSLEGLFKPNCSILLPLDKELLLIITQGSRRNKGHLFVVKKLTGELVFHERIVPLFNNATKEGDSVYLSARDGSRYLLSINDYTLTNLSSYETTLTHGFMCMHDPINALTAKHTKFIEYGSKHDSSGTNDRACYIHYKDIETGSHYEYYFNDEIYIASILPCEERAVVAMKVNEKAEIHQYILVMEIATGAVCAMINLNIEPSYKSKVDFLKPINENLVLVGFKNGVSAIVKY